MRTTHYLGWILVCLLALGCNGTKWGKPAGSSMTGSGNGKDLADPFVLSSRDGTTRTDPVNGILAGYALDRWRNPLSEATIEILDLNDQPSGGKRARITTTTDRAGQYKFEGLNPSHQYQLIARTRDGNQQLVGSVLGSPPNPRLPIYLTEDYGGTDPRSASREEDTKTSQPRDPKNSLGTPAATLAPPVRDTPDIEQPVPTPTPTNSLPGTPIPGRSEDRSRSTQDSFERQPVVTIPGPETRPSPVVPPPPRPGNPIPGTAPVAPQTPSTGNGIGLNLGTPSGPSPALPEMSITTPSCVLIGRKLTNFSLLNMEGQPWIFSRDRDRNSRVVLLDFWHTQCAPCLQCLPSLRGLQQSYGPHGLQIIGIAHEQGPLDEAVSRIRGARGRYNINYTTIVSGTTPQPCPVMAQFQVSRFPTMVLLDETGTIIWRKEGVLDPQSQLELEFILRKKLGLASR